MNENKPQTDGPEREVLVLGAGLAGSFAARALAQRGWSVRVVDRQAIGADGPASYAMRVALLQPKINDEHDPPGSQLREGFTLARRIVTEQLVNDPRIGWQPCGAFHAAYDGRSERRLRRFVDQFAGSGMCRWIEPQATHEELGVALDVGGVVIDAAGLLRPAGLCAALLDHPGIVVQGKTEVAGLHKSGSGWQVRSGGGAIFESRRIVVANAMDARQLDPTRHLNLCPVRGQVSLIPVSTDNAAAQLAGLRRTLCFGGYLTPALGGQHTLGASFVPADTSTDWRDAEHRSVCERLARVLPEIAGSFRRQPDAAGWAGIRVTTPNRLPYAGPIERDGQALPGLYASLGHGSHGIASAAISANHLVDSIA